MINRDMKVAELWEKNAENTITFGADEESKKIKNIYIALYEKNVSRMELNSNDVFQYDMVGLTKDNIDINKNMYLVCDSKTYSIEYVCNSNRFRQLFLKRVI